MVRLRTTIQSPAWRKPTAYAVPRSELSASLTADYQTYSSDLVIERNRPGKPHQGKVLVAIQAHSDDITLFCARSPSSSTRSTPATSSECPMTRRPERRSVTAWCKTRSTNQEAAKALGCKKALFYYRNHRMDDCAIIEIRQRLIFMFRLQQVNTVFAMDPYDHYDENPNHLVVGKAMEAACWMANPEWDRPPGLSCSSAFHASE